MTGFAATEELRAALAQSRAEAVELNHEYIGTEHLLLGVVTPPSALVGKLLAIRNVDSIEVRESVESIVMRGRISSGPDLPYTSSSKHVLEFALNEARAVSADAMNAGHLFLGILGEGKGIGAQVLDRLGFTLAEVRRQYAELTADGHGERVSRHGEHSPGRGDFLVARGNIHDMPPMAAVAALQMMARSPRVAAVLEQHGVDVQAIIRDLSALPP